MKFLSLLAFLWTSSTFAADSAMLYVSDQNERTVLSDYVYLDSGGMAVGQGYHIYLIEGLGDWQMTVGAPYREQLAVKFYPGVQRYSRDSTQPSFAISGPRIGCGVNSGAFKVLEIDSSAGKLTKLAVDFIVQCADNNTLSGAIRMNTNLTIHKPIQL